MLSSVRKSLREGLLFEYDVVDSKRVRNQIDHIRYVFTVNDVLYNVNFWHDDRMHRFGEYELEFSVEEQINTGQRVGKDLKHLNTVLYTVTNIIEREVKEKGILRVKIEGAGDAKDTGSMLNPTLRAKLYLRFLRSKYPTDAISTAGRYINMDMTKIFPNMKKDAESSSDKLIKALLTVSDADPDEAGLRRGLSGKDESQFVINTDFVESSKFGNIYVEIRVWGAINEYELSWDIGSTGNEGSKEFENVDQMVEFILANFK
tara:strand:- start:10340 stop:11122 length:783 start_codon:yes stop_codon:yes gene_type:complete